MNVRVEFDRDHVRLDLGDLDTLTRELVADGAAAQWQAIFAAMRENGIQGITEFPNGTLVPTPVD